MAKEGYLLYVCGSDTIVYTDENLENYLGSVVTAEEYPGVCATVGVSQTISDEIPFVDVTITSCHSSCEDCERVAYRLVDCSGRYDDKYTLDIRLSDHVGSIIRIPYFYDTCFEVEEVQYDSGERYYETITFEGPYETCDSCRKLEPVYPTQEYNGCDVERIGDVKCTFAELWYQHTMSKRFGVKFCCPVDKDRATIKNEIINIEIINHEDPPLPEPYVEPCCIPTRPNCSMPVQNSCRTCEDTPTPVEDVQCNCEASPNSPHDCHLYSYTISSEQLALATGNTTTYLNGKLFFAYYRCKDTVVTTNVYTEPTEVEDVCVLGIPIFGYFVNEQWFDLFLERGEICEQNEELNNCCNG